MAILVGWVGCLRPMAERVERDLEVGQASHGALEVRVEDGLAAIRGLDDDGLWLWANAPVLQLHIRPDPAASAPFQITVHNLMLQAELQVLEGTVEVLDHTPLGATRARWTVRFAPAADPADGEVVLRIGPPDRPGEPFRFAVLSDIQEALDRVEDIYLRMNQEPDIAFALGIGDLTQRGTRRELNTFQRKLQVLHVPYYATLGNHELGVSPPPWHELFGRGSFRFLFHGVQFTLIDSASASIDPRVYGWLEDWLDEGRDRVHIVGMHVPPVDPIGVRNGSFASRNEAAKLLAMLAAGRVDMTIYGHIHSYYKFYNAGIEAHISGGGGAIPEKFDGMGRHFMVFEVDPEAGIRGSQVIQVDR